MLAHTDLKKGVRFILDNQPYEVIESSFVFKGRGSSLVQTKIKNLISGHILSRTFHPGEEFEKAEISKIEANFLYSHRGKFFFCQKENPSKRFDLTADQIGERSKFLKPNQTVEGMIFENKIINVFLPIKIQLKVIEAPPGIKGDRTQGGMKIVTLESGAKITVPLFIKEGDLIEINSERGEYLRRIE